jgi:Phage tail assembly chaperone protein, TAC
MATIKLGGKERELKFAFSSLRALEQYYKKPVGKVFSENIASESLEALVVMLWACLYKSDKKLTVEKVEELIDESLENEELTFEDLKNALQEAFNNSVLTKAKKEVDEKN